MIQRSKEQLQYLEKRYYEVKNEFIIIENKLAEYKDRNLVLNSYKSEVELRKLTSEYNISFSLYNQLAKELESQRLEVKKDTPVFTILEPVTIPLERSKPIRSSIIKLWFLSGFMFSIFIIITSHILFYLFISYKKIN